jgi:hypothetical protein
MERRRKEKKRKEGRERVERSRKEGWNQSTDTTQQDE